MNILNENREMDWKRRRRIAGASGEGSNYGFGAGIRRYLRKGYRLSDAGCPFLLDADQVR